MASGGGTKNRAVLGRAWPLWAGTLSVAEGWTGMGSAADMEAFQGGVGARTTGVLSTYSCGDIKTRGRG